MVTVDDLLKVMKRIIESAENTSNNTAIVDRAAVIDAIVLYRNATGKTIRSRIGARS